MSRPQDDLLDGVAIVGLACRFPGARNAEEFWRNLAAGVESVTFFTDEELLAAGVHPDVLRDPSYVKAAPVLEDVDLFDAGLFGDSPREAELMDPQQRLFLECAWETLENAGYDSTTCRERIGVYAGVRLDTYWLGLYHGRDAVHAPDALQVLTGNDKDYLTTRVSYRLNLRGPSIGVQTACSTSLVAVAMASQALQGYQCDMALAGGVAVRVPQVSGYFHRPGGIASPDGHCRAFSADARGSVFGSGVGIVALKRLEDALRDGDHIRAVIRGAAVNNDGALKVGFTAPSEEGQVEVIATAQAIAGVAPETITCIEAHGTGTTLGDPIELAALQRVFRAGTGRKGFCAIGSVKTNIGHLDCAAGVAGLIKTALALENGQIPPSLNFSEPNPALDLANSPFYVNTELRPWASEGPRRAGVSSFGIGGTNAHVVLEEAPPSAPSGPARPWHLLPLSARTPAALEAATRNLTEHLRRHPDLPPADVAFTLQAGRRAQRHRRVVLCDGLAGAAAALESLDPRHVWTGNESRGDAPVAFLFPGQGSQYAGMGRELYREEAAFRAEIDRCAEILRPRLGFDPREVLLPAPEGEEDAGRRLEQTGLTQPLLFAVEYALARLWMSWGVKPQAMAGHSVGEYVAACIAGVFSLEDGLELLAARGRLMQALPPGAMLAVPLPEPELLGCLPDGVALAAVNAPGLCVVSGSREAVAELERALASRGVDSRPLRTSHAFHSAMMEPVLEPFAAALRRVRLSPPRLSVLSNLTGSWLTAAEATDPAYWTAHLRRTVRFSDNLLALASRARILLEVGPGRSLATLARQHFAVGDGPAVLTSLRHPKDEASDLEHFTATVGRLWLAGGGVDWGAYHSGQRRRRVPLPTYPFERQRYWLDPPDETQTRPAAPAAPREKGVEDWFHVPVWHQSVLPPLPAGSSARGSSWLVFEDGHGLSAGLARRLRGAGRRVVSVLPGEGFAALGDDLYAISPGRGEDYAALFQALRATGKTPDSILHAWGVGDEPATEGDLLDRGFFSLLFLAQACGAEAGSGRVELRVLTTGVQAVSGEEPLQPVKAAVLGTCAVIPQELPGLLCQSLDVALPSPGREPALLDRLWEELAAEPADPAVAYRGGRRWVRAFAPLRLDEAAGQGGRLRERGVYLITGGWGGIGLALARHLARTVRARLVLVGRSSMPEREVRDLEALGAEVLAVSADVTRPEEMAAAVERARERFGTIHGAIHAAGVPGGGLLRLKTREAAERVLAPKMRGAAVLAKALGGLGLDFLVFFSSTIGLTGAFGQIDYSAANAVLDAFAHDRAAREPGLTLAVDWDGWRDVGMTAGRAGSPGTGGHPFLQELVARTPEREVFAARLDASGDWVLAEHRVMGWPVLPGTAYLELAHAFASRRAGGRAVELRDVTFLAPMVVRNGSGVEIRAVLDGGDDGGRLRVFSRPAGGAGAWEEHAAAQVAYVDPQPAGRAAVTELTGGARVVDRGLGEEERARYMELGPRWNVVSRVEVGDGEVLTLVELPEALTADLDRFGLHPGLLDRATSFAIRYLAGGYYLPLSYRRLTVYGRLPRRVLSHLRLRAGDPAAQSGTLTFDLRLSGERGEELVAIEGFTVRRIEDVEVLRQALSAPAVPVRDTAALGGEGEAGMAPGPRGIDPERGLEAFRRLLDWGGAPQVAVSPRDMAAAMAEARAFGEAVILERLEKGTATPSAAHPRPDLQVAYVAPRDETEREVAGLWQKLLGIDRVGVEDDFFELGGHSLLAVRLAAELRSALGVELPARDLFDTPTVSGLALRVKAARGAGASPVPPPLVPVPRGDDLPLSFAQERQWFLARLEPESPLYNHAAGLRMSGRLDVAALAGSLDEIIRRHESFRSTFVAVSGRPVLRINPPVRRSLPVVDLSALPPARGEEEAARLGKEEARRPFDLAVAPLLRALLVRLGEREQAVWFVMHHIAGDHWSSGILVRELAALYAAFAAGQPSPLPEPPLQYADFAHWQRRWLSGEVLAAELDYWRRQLGGRLPVLELPTDRPRPAVQSPRGASEPFELSPALSDALRALARGERATPFMILLGGLLVVLHRLTGQEDIIVGAPVAGRDRPELDGMIGYFINALALRTSLSGDPGFRELLERVREVTLGAYAHQELPFEKLVEELKPERRAGRSPIFQVVFNYQNAAPTAPVELPGMILSPLPAGRGTAKYDFTLYMWETADRLAGSFEYKTDLFDAATIARLRGELAAVLERVVAEPDIRLSRLTGELSAQETEKRMIRQEEVNSSNLKKLKITKRRAVQISQEDLVRIENLESGPLPLVIRPNVEDIDLEAWTERNLELIERELLTHGAILFRGFAVGSPAAFERFVNRVTPDLVNYVEGSSPRIMVGDKVYTSTEYPAEYFVSMHNELSYAHKWPSKIFFYCQTVAQQGGETPIADSRKVWERIDPEIRRKFQEKGVTYTRNLHGDRGAGLSWQTVFETSDRAAVEAYCREGGIEFHWREDGGLATRQVRPAVIKHPKTGELVWFNQVDQWHPSNLGTELAAALLATTREEDLPVNACFGDGTPLDAAELDHVRNVFRETMVAFPWEQGDVLMLDNTLTAHGRMPFTPPRRVLVAMGGGTVRLSDLAE